MRKRGGQFKPRINPLWKTCSLCGEDWLIFMFRDRAGSPDGHRHDCTPCMQKRDNRYTASHGDRNARRTKKLRKPKNAEQKREEAFGQHVRRVLKPGHYQEINCRHYQKHRKRILQETAQQRRDYYHNNKQSVLATQAIYQRRKRKIDPIYNLLIKLRTRIRDTLKDLNKSAKTMDLIGCNPEHLKRHFFSLFKNGMTMKHFLRGEIHVDHVIPCSAFNLIDPQQQRQCFHWSNLQPLWANENLKKSDKVIISDNNNPEFAAQPVSARIYREMNGRAIAEAVTAIPFSPADSASSSKIEQAKSA